MGQPNERIPALMRALKHTRQECSKAKILRQCFESQYQRWTFHQKVFMNTATTNLHGVVPLQSRRTSGRRSWFPSWLCSAPRLWESRRFLTPPWTAQSRLQSRWPHRCFLPPQRWSWVQWRGSRGHSWLGLWNFLWQRHRWCRWRWWRWWKGWRQWSLVRHSWCFPEPESRK